jgi:uncharacterized membrane protein
MAAVWRSVGAPCQLLGTLGGATSEATGINAHGEVVGMSDTTILVSQAPPEGQGLNIVSERMERRPFLWRNGKMVDLNHLIPAQSGWELVRVTAINDRGEIAAWGRKDGKTWAVVLRPQPQK